MAGETRAVDIGDDDLLPPWSTVRNPAVGVRVPDMCMRPLNMTELLGCGDGH